MNIEKFDKPVLEQMRKEMQAALNEVAAKHGLSIQMKNISFNEFSFKAPIEVKIVGKAKDYSEQYPFMKLPKIGTQFINGGKKFEVIEHKIDRPKFPIVAKEIGNTTGRELTYKFTVEAVAFCLARTEATK